MTAADKYYLKAADNYPCNMEQAMEDLDYGLSCDNEHPGLLSLMGTVYFHNLFRYDAARECFELALISDPQYVEAYYGYIKLSLWTNEFARAEKLLAAALKIKGIDTALIAYFEALTYEKQDRYSNAIDSMEKAKKNSLSKQCFTFYQEETTRLEQKKKLAKKRKAAGKNR